MYQQVSPIGWWLVFVLVSVTALAGCAQATPEVVLVEKVVTREVEVEREVVKTVEVEKEVVVEAEELSGHIGVVGSGVVRPLAERLAKMFVGVNPRIEVELQEDGPGTGIESVGQGTADVGMASRAIRQSELDEYTDLQVYIIGWEGVVIVGDPHTTVNWLTRENVRDIFTGNITDWSELGGPGGPVTVVSREEGSEIRAAFEEMAMGESPIVDTAILVTSNDEVRATVSSIAGAVGFLPFDYLDASVKAVPIDGVEPTEANVANGAYTFARPLSMITSGEPTAAVRAWLDFAISPAGQAAVIEEGHIPLYPPYASLEDIYILQGWPEPELCYRRHGYPDLTRVRLDDDIVAFSDGSEHIKDGHKISVIYRNEKGQEFLITVHGQDYDTVENYLEGLDVCLEAIEAETGEAGEAEVPTAFDLSGVVDAERALIIEVELVSTDLVEAGVPLLIYYVFDPEFTRYGAEIHYYDYKYQQDAVVVWTFVRRGKVKTNLWTLDDPGAGQPSNQQEMTLAVYDLGLMVEPDPSTGITNTQPVCYLTFVQDEADFSKYDIGGWWKFYGACSPLGGVQSGELSHDRNR